MSIRYHYITTAKYYFKFRADNCFSQFSILLPFFIMAILQLQLISLCCQGSGSYFTVFFEIAKQPFMEPLNRNVRVSNLPHEQPYCPEDRTGGWQAHLAILVKMCEHDGV